MMEPLPSGQRPKKTSAERFDEAQANRRNTSILDVARYLADVESRLRKEDYHRFGRALADIHRAENSPEGDVAAAKEAARLIISGDTNLAARFDEFLRSTDVISEKEMPFECPEEGRAPSWNPQSGKDGGSGSGTVSGSS